MRLHYSFEAATQSGAALSHPLFDMLGLLRKHGSILAAAKASGSSYRYLWGALRRWEVQLGQPLLVWSQGKRALLTPFAERLMWSETQARVRMTPHIEAMRSELVAALEEARGTPPTAVRLFASHDLALPQLMQRMRDGFRHPMSLRFCGSLDALDAVGQGRCLLAGFHVPNAPDLAAPLAQAMRQRLQPGQHKLIASHCRDQGLMVRPDTAPKLAELGDLARQGLRFVNRQPGSGTRLLMDHMLAQAGWRPQDIPGWLDAAEESHLAVAAMVASGQADAGPGVAAAAAQFGLAFVPLAQETYYLVCLKPALDLPAVQDLRSLLAGRSWAAELGLLPGYSPAPQCGEVLSLTRALPWWELPGSGRRGRAQHVNGRS